MERNPINGATTLVEPGEGAGGAGYLTGEDVADKPRIKRGDSKKRLSTQGIRGGGAGAVAKSGGDGGGGDSRGSRKGRKTTSQNPPLSSGIVVIQ